MKVNKKSIKTIEKSLSQLRRLLAKWCNGHKSRKPHAHQNKIVGCDPIDEDHAKHYQAEIDSALSNSKWWEYKGGPLYSEAEHDDIRTIVESKIHMFGIKLRDDDDFDDDPDDYSSNDGNEDELIEKVSEFICSEGNFLGCDEIAAMKLGEFTKFVELVLMPDPRLLQIASLEVEAEKLVQSIRQFQAELWRTACKQK